MKKRLVVHSNQDINTRNLKELGVILKAEEIKKISEEAFRLEGVHLANHNMNEVKAYCQKHQLDYALMTDQEDLNHIRLVVMDMDSTLINIECIDEIADFCNLKPQVSEITESAMRGEIDFQESLRRRVRLLKGLNANVLDRVYNERLQVHSGGEFMFETFKKHGIKTMLVSGGFNFFTDRLKTLLGIDYTASNTLEIDSNGCLTGEVLGDIVDAQKKADLLLLRQKELGLETSQIIAMGDGANDLKMMAVAGISIAYHAKPVVQEQARVAFNYVNLEGVINILA